MIEFGTNLLGRINPEGVRLIEHTVCSVCGKPMTYSWPTSPCYGRYYTPCFECCEKMGIAYTRLDLVDRKELLQ